MTTMDAAVKTKLLASLEGLTAQGAERVMRALGERFPQFRFDGSAGLVPAQARAEATGRRDVFAHGPWHLSARERPAMDSMRMFAEGAAAMCREPAEDCRPDQETDALRVRAKNVMARLAQTASEFEGGGSDEEAGLCREAAEVVNDLAAAVPADTGWVEWLLAREDP